jgi:hypothetical protein
MTRYLGKPCVCDGRYDGCEHGLRCGVAVTDDRLGPWCTGCNPRRLGHISAQFEAMDFGGGAA